MSTLTETFHVRGARRSRVLEAIEQGMAAQGLRLVTDRATAERTEPYLRRLVVRRDGPWHSVADEERNQLETWGTHLSQALERSVLTIWSWDGEASVIATRWRDGHEKARLTLLEEAYHDDDGRPRAPARVLWPWLPAGKRATILQQGIMLREPSAGTGDRDLDALLEDFEAREDETDGDPFVTCDVSCAAIAGAAGIRHRAVDPWSPADGDVELIFRPIKRRV